MATVINNPPGQGDSGGNSALIITVVVVIILVFAFFVFALPALRNSKQNSGTNINVPDKINVDVNKQPSY